MCRNANWSVLIGAILLSVAGWFLFRQFADYQYMTDRHVADILRAKLWSIVWLMISFGVVYLKRRSTIAPALAVLAVSAYFVVLYGYLFRGTEYGMNSHWGDNGYRFATICKMLASGKFVDAYVKGLPSMYPPLWFWFMACIAKISELQAYHTLKIGYLAVFLIYPWAIYFMWKPLVSRVAAAAVAMGTLFLGHTYLNYIYYEHMACALFVPWWLYFFEDATERTGKAKFDWRFYVAGALIGAAIFMTYYYWFFLAIVATPASIAYRALYAGGHKVWWEDVRRRLILACGVALLAAVYWVPLLIAAFKFGLESKQATWFNMAHANITGHWQNQAVEGSIILLGGFFLAYLWSRWPSAKIGILYLAGLVMIAIDRATNLGAGSIQTRKILEFAHVLALAPLGIGVVAVWRDWLESVSVRRGVVAVGLILSIAYSNEHVESLFGSRYERSVNQRLPEYELSVFDAAAGPDAVFLTNHYIEACYRPYSMFAPVSNVPAHQSCQYRDRIAFLHAAEQISEPELLSYVFHHNRFDDIEYVYLPKDQTTDTYYFALNFVGFNSKFSCDTLRYAASLLESNDSFTMIHKAGLFEVGHSSKSLEAQAMLVTKYPGITAYLAPVSLEGHVE